MSDDALEIVRRYLSKGLVIDSNILLLLLVGMYDTSLISQFKRTQKFTSEDYVLLTRLLKLFRVTVTTPNVLTEVNGLTNQLTGRVRETIRERFAATIAEFVEVYVPSVTASLHPAFKNSGLTDAVLAEAAHGKYLVLTDDYQLAGKLQSLGIAALNFNHIRWLSWRRL
jgi:rRNA-processing protein FCF1